jgi:hypothetical protein
MLSESQWHARIITIVTEPKFLLSRTTLLVLGAAVALFPCRDVQAQESKILSDSHMSEALRSPINKVVIVPGEGPAGQAVTGSYKKGTAGLYGGMAAGQQAGTVISKDVGAVSLGIPIPILTYPGMIIGGIAGATQKEIQEFRDTLTKDLAEASSLPLANEKIASDVYSGVRKLPNLEPKLFAPTTPIPEDTDAIVFVSLQDVSIEVQGNEAIITTTAKATVHRRSDETDVYAKTIQYQDRDTLSHWTDNENALWRDYASFARHYIGREISAEVFYAVSLKHTLLPIKSDTVKLDKKNVWQGSSKSLGPTLAWELNLLGGDIYGAWTDEIDESDIYYDVEIYDLHRPVYSRQQIQDPRHTVAVELDACQSYRWSVRPSYHVDGDIRYGEWMRSDTATGNGNVGKKASKAPAYIQDFAALDIKCSAK